jgi:hypothetical protein
MECGGLVHPELRRARRFYRVISTQAAYFAATRDSDRMNALIPSAPVNRKGMHFLAGDGTINKVCQKQT